MKNNLFKKEKWEEYKFKEVFELKQGQYIKPSDFVVNGYNIYGANGVIGKSAEYMYENETVLISCRGAKCGVVHFTKPKSWVNNNSIALIPKRKDIEPKFIYYSSINSGFNGFITGSAQPQIVINVLELKKIQLPPINEQKKIAEILSKVDGDIEATEKIIKKTEKLKSGLMQELLTKGIGHKKFKKTKIGMIPEEWGLAKLNEICDKITDGTHRTPKYISDGIPFLRVTDIQDRFIDWNNVKYISREEHQELIKRCRPERGDVLLSKNGTIGITKIIDWSREFSIFVSLCLIKPKKSIVDSVFLNKLIGSDFILNQAKMRSKQGAVTNLHLEEIRDFDVPLPKIDEQRKIAGIVTRIDEKIEIYKMLKSKLEILKKGLMQDLLNGID